jgi:acetylornithine deacetylase/succinyl-diaminopimelate desuccinylase-like protein
MRAGLAVNLLLSRLVKELGLELPGRLITSYSADEEAAGTWGTRWLLEQVPEFHADACLIGDQCGVWAVGIGEKGGVWLRLRTRGTSGHAAYGSARGAVTPLLRALAVVEGLEGTVVEPPAVLAPYLERERGLVAAEWGEEAPLILDRVTANVGRLEGGVSINLVAEACQAELDVRLPIGLATGEVLERLRSGFREAGLDQLDVELIAAFEPNWTHPDHPLVRAVRDNGAAVTGDAPLPLIRLGATDARWFRAAGIPTVVYGPTAYNMGRANESVTVEDLLVTARVHAGAMVDYFTFAYAEGEQAQPS